MKTIYLGNQQVIVRERKGRINVHCTDMNPDFLERNTSLEAEEIYSEQIKKSLKTQ